MDQVIIAIKDITNRDILRRAIEYVKQGIPVVSAPVFYEETMGKIPTGHLTDQWIIDTGFKGVKPNFYNRRVKKLLDNVLSVLGLIAGAPIILFAGLCIRLDSPGPIFFRQLRVGVRGRSFEMLKLRTMAVCADPDSPSRCGLPNPWITRVGAVIRKLRIDELPQFWNVLRGDMSLIGPRPLIEKEVALFDKEVPYFSLRHVVKPGITGWAQVNYPHGDSLTDAREKVQYDLFYIKNLSFLLDLRVFIRTIRVMLCGKGAK